MRRKTERNEREILHREHPVLSPHTQVIFIMQSVERENSERKYLRREENLQEKGENVIRGWEK